MCQISFLLLLNAYWGYLYNAAGVLILETWIFLGILKCLSKKIVEDSLIVREFMGRHKFKHKPSGMLYIVFVFSL